MPRRPMAEIKRGAMSAHCGRNRAAIAPRKAGVFIGPVAGGAALACLRGRRAWREYRRNVLAWRRL